MKIRLRKWNRLLKIDRDYVTMNDEEDNDYLQREKADVRARPIPEN
jgi:hypothetical protein